MTLVNEAHTDPIELYSEIRTDASTKVTSNEVMVAMLEHFDEQGFNDYARQGFAPITSAGGAVQSFEVEGPQGTIFLVNGPEVREPGRKAFRKCLKAFLEIQEMTLQAQAVEYTDGADIFNNPTPSRSKKNR